MFTGGTMQTKTSAEAATQADRPATPYLDLGYVPCREAWGKPPAAQPAPGSRTQVFEDIRLTYAGAVR
jgi:hypothetical protein